MAVIVVIVSEVGLVVAVVVVVVSVETNGPTAVININCYFSLVSD